MMRLRRYKLDQLAEKVALEPSKITALNTIPAKKQEEHLRFWTLHKTKAMLVDLTPFRDGEFQKKAAGRWGGDFSGRPVLIEQLFPVLHTLLVEASFSTVDKYLHSLRSWWRLFDEIERDSAFKKLQIARVTTVSDLCEIHRRIAHDKTMQRSEFSNFLRIANLVRASEDMPKLFWQAPEQPEPSRKLAPEWQIKLIRIELKHMWRDTRLRWELALELVKGKKTENAEERRLLANYRRFQAVTARTKNPVPPAPEIWHTLTYDQFSDQGFRKSDMLAGFFPDANDIRVAFFLCLANTGWNPVVLLTLNAGEPFIVPHPKDPSRYLLYGYKERGDSQQISEGLYKTQGSAGVILLTLLKRTEPLRGELRKHLVRAQAELSAADEQNYSIEQRDKLKRRVLSLKEGIRSPWLYCTSKHGISWLEHSKYMIASKANVAPNERPRFLDIVVDNINTRQPAEKKLSYIKPGDFRDAFAAYAYRMSGGLVLFVMKQLHHKSPSTTQDYLNNTIINSESQWKFMTFINGMWDEVKDYGRIDPSILAKMARDGRVTAEDRDRLNKYRVLSRSRLNIGCKDPTRPPKQIAPRFEANGTSMCSTHRCTLCVQNAVIFHDSLPGLAMRVAELRWLKATMSYEAFLESSFETELINAELALRHFDKDEVARLILDWENKILVGEHRVIQFENS